MSAAGRPFHAMLKPAGAQCNMQCAYCYYLHKQELLQQPAQPRMSEAVLSAHIRQYIAAQDTPAVVFSWQGGEPTLMGLDFFRRVVQLQAVHRKLGQRIENDLQTNGLLLDDEWCAFLRQHNFLVGLSVDGPPALHDAYRRSRGDQPTFARVMQAVERLRRHGVDFSALCVVNRLNARRPIDVYRFLRDHVGPRLIQFIPGVQRADFSQRGPGPAAPGEEEEEREVAVTEWSLRAEDWGYFLNRVWDEWLRRDFGKVFVDQFENIIALIFGHGAQSCVNSPQCGRGLAVEHNGDVYSCDHYAYAEYRLGNILQTDLGSLAACAQQEAFAQAKHSMLPGYCRACRYLPLCWGECPRNRFRRTPDGEAGLNYLCPGLKAFYARALAARGEIAARLGWS